MRCLREAEGGRGEEGGRGMGSVRERERGGERLEDDNNARGGLRGKNAVWKLTVDFEMPSDNPGAEIETAAAVATAAAA